MYCVSDRCVCVCVYVCVCVSRSLHPFPPLSLAGSLPTASAGGDSLLLDGAATAGAVTSFSRALHMSAVSSGEDGILECWFSRCF